MREIVLVILAILMFTSFLGAQTSVQPLGSGTDNSPYLITNLNNLYWIAENPIRWNQVYLQTADIDAAQTATWFNGQGWPGIGSEVTFFTGKYDGGLNSLTNLHSNRTYGTGLFGIISGAVLTRINLLNADIIGGTGMLSDGSYASTVSHCMVSGSLSSPFGPLGGMIGSVTTTSISYCSATVSVTNTGAELNTYQGVGGMIGDLSSNSSLDWSNADCQVNGGVKSFVGGLVGRTTGGIISNCYSASQVSGTGIFLGVLVGSAPGGIIVNSFYDLDSCIVNYTRQISIGALPQPMYGQWLAANRALDINSYLTLENGCYLIQSEADFIPLMAFAQLPDLSFRLTANLNLSGLPGYFVPLLAGDFDGGGRSISNLSVSTTNLNTVGLFGCVSNAQICDLEITDFNLSGGVQIGGLVGNAGEGTVIHNCSASGTIQQHGFQTQNNYYALGGLVGFAVHAVIDTCEAEINIVATGNPRYIGGLVGRAEYTQIHACSSDGVVLYNYFSTVDLFTKTGGLAGSVSETWLSDCRSEAWVTAYNWVGGLVGSCDSGSSIERSFSSGEVHGIDRVGGLVGAVSEDAEVSACSSTATVSGYNKVGGLVGSNNGSLANCYAMGSVNGGNEVGGLLGSLECWYVLFGSIANCYSTGQVIGSGTQVGGLVGGSYGSNNTGGCYWDIQTSGQSSSIIGAGRTTAQMIFPHSSDTYVGWDFDNVWAPDYQHLLNNGYPFLRNTIPGSPQIDPMVPSPALLLKVYPNPFTATTTLGFSLPKTDNCHLDIFNLRGQKIRSFDLSGFKQGEHNLVWDGRDHSGRNTSSGIYLIRLQTGCKSILVKAIQFR